MEVQDVYDGQGGKFFGINICATMNIVVFFGKTICNILDSITAICTWYPSDEIHQYVMICSE
jgi:hypothetical protein